MRQQTVEAGGWREQGRRAASDATSRISAGPSGATGGNGVSGAGRAGSSFPGGGQGASKGNLILGRCAGERGDNNACGGGGSGRSGVERDGIKGTWAGGATAAAEDETCGSSGGGCAAGSVGDDSAGASPEGDSGTPPFPVLLNGSVWFICGGDRRATWTRQEEIGRGSSGTVYMAIEGPMGESGGAAPVEVRGGIGVGVGQGSRICEGEGEKSGLEATLDSGVGFGAAAAGVRRIAAKRMFASDEEDVAAIDREISMVRSLHYQHIVLHLGEARHGFDRYLLMEWMGGGTVRQMLDARHTTGLPHDVLGSYAAQVLSGLRFLHESLVVHCDLKGDNVLLNESLTIAKIGDFGSATQLSSEHGSSPVTGGLRGSPFWMAPEYICTQRSSPRSDVWSYGCLVLEMLTGSPPWHDPATPAGGSSTFQLMNRIVSESGPPPMPDAMPPGFLQMLSACFRRDLDERPTCEQLRHFEWVRQWGGACQ